MITNKVTATLEEADLFLSEAKEEMNRSKDDIVLFMACSKSRKAIQRYLNYYLLKNNIEFSEEDTIEELLEKCLVHKSHFETVKIGNTECSQHGEDGKFCTDVKKINSCLQIAEATKTVISEEEKHWPLSKRVK